MDHLATPRVNGDIGDALSFLMVVSAARADATSEQREALRTRIPPLLEQFRLDGETWPVLREVRRIMGNDWRPKDEWVAWLEEG